MSRLKELIEERARVTKAGRDVLERADKKTGKLTAEDETAWQAHNARLTEIDDEIPRLQKQAAAELEQATLEARLNEPTGRKTQATTPPALPATSGNAPGSVARRFLVEDIAQPTTLSHETSFTKSWQFAYLDNGTQASGEKLGRRSLDIEPSHRETREYGEAVKAYIRGGAHSLTPKNVAALQADSDTVGGYLVMPQQMVWALIKFIDNQTFFRSLATVYSVPNAQSLGAPSLDTDISDATWTGELLTGSEDSSIALGKRELNPHPLAIRVKISNKLLRMAMIGADSLVMQRMGYKFGTVQEAAFMTGSGALQPLGIFTASTLGISTSRDAAQVAADGSSPTTTIYGDGLIRCFYSLKAQYMERASWIFHRDAIAQIRRLKESTGNYIWQPGLASDRPNTILGRPYFMSEYAPNTFTTGQYVGIVGDFSNYWIADSLALTVQRLTELYAETNQMGFIGRAETDGMPVLEEAFARLKLQ